MNPNAYLAVAISYLFGHRPDWRADAGVGKTLVSSSLIDKVAADLGRRLVEVPVGFKWFVPGLTTGDLGFGGEESAGASFLRGTGPPGRTMTEPAGPARQRDPGRHREFASELYARLEGGTAPPATRWTPRPARAEGETGQALGVRRHRDRTAE